MPFILTEERQKFYSVDIISLYVCWRNSNNLEANTGACAIPRQWASHAWFGLNSSLIMQQWAVDDLKQYRHADIFTEKCLAGPVEWREAGRRWEAVYLEYDCWHDSISLPSWLAKWGISGKIRNKNKAEMKLTKWKVLMIIEAARLSVLSRKTGDWRGIVLQ